MAKVVSCVPFFRIVIRGGDACKTLDDYLQTTKDAMDCGVGGLTTGRFVWENPLLKAKNCILTPHISRAPKESRQRLMDVAVDNLEAFLRKEAQDVVNF